jgi:hypothetical protein
MTKYVVISAACVSLALSSLVMIVRGAQQINHPEYIEECRHHPPGECGDCRPACNKIAQSED